MVNHNDTHMSTAPRLGLGLGLGFRVVRRGGPWKGTWYYAVEAFAPGGATRQYHGMSAKKDNNSHPPFSLYPVTTPTSTGVPVHGAYRLPTAAHAVITCMYGRSQ